MLLLSFALTLTQTRGEQPNANSLLVEKEQHWEDTYGRGGTCIFATHNIALADLDGDGETEIATGGFAYDLDNGTRTRSSAPLKIWSWNGTELTLEAVYRWPGTANESANIVCVTAGDINRDGTTNLLTAGNMFNQTGSYAQLRIWLWNAVNLTLLTSKEWNGTLGSSAVTSAIIDDADKDGNQEILTAGKTTDASKNETDAQLMVWSWNGTELNLLESAEWHDGTAASANSLAAADLDNDGETEIITAGYNQALTNSSGQLRIWHWNGTELTLQADQEWQTKPDIYALTSASGIQGNTVINNVKTADIDNDGTPEIATGGFTFDGDQVNGQLRIWNYTNQTTNLEKSYEWTTEYITEVKSISLNDVDGDGNTEIVTSGVTAGQNSFAENATIKEMAQLKIWNWNGTALAIKQSVDWTVGEGVCAWNVASGDVDKDGTVEILTVGCMFVENLCDPDMRIWSIAEDVTPSPTATPSPQPSSYSLQTELVIAASGSLAVIVLSTIYLLKIRASAKKAKS
jgi:hypothetical protein